jgi:MFS superfamily sulfate permease-like transporter
MGILKGLIFAVGLTLIALMRKLSSPQDSVLGMVPGSGNFVDVSRHAQAEQIPGLVIFRPNGVLFFANANRIHNRVRELVKQCGQSLRGVLINLEASPDVDVTSLEMLIRLQKELHASGIELYFARVADPVRDLFERSGFLHELGKDRIFTGIHIAVAKFLETGQLMARLSA